VLSHAILYNGRSWASTTPYPSSARRGTPLLDKKGLGVVVVKNWQGQETRIHSDEVIPAKLVPAKAGGAGIHEFSDRPLSPAAQWLTADGFSSPEKGVQTQTNPLNLKLYGSMGYGKKVRNKPMRINRHVIKDIERIGPRFWRNLDGGGLRSRIVTGC
jgi:hypothetical protein